MDTRRQTPICILACSECKCNILEQLEFNYDASDWLEDQEVMAIFRISYSTLFRMRARKLLPSVKISGKTLYPKQLLYHCLLFKKY
jgi:hypothetical protein